MKLLELFAGSRSVGKVAEKMGWEVFSSDYEPFENIDLVKDIREVTANDIPFIPDVLWLSPPCQAFSVCTIGKNWNKEDNSPKSDSAKLGLELVDQAIRFIDYYSEINPNLIWFMENPRGMLRKLDIVKNIPITTVTYCQYGHSSMKPTDIWSNHISNEDNPNGWKPKPICKNGSPCHVAAPRGSRTGIQGLQNAYERGKIPEKLVKEILESC